MDTLIDYAAITQEKEVGTDLGKKIQTVWDTATNVWEMATTEPACIPCLHEGPANWYRFEPRFSGGVWNSAFAGLNTGTQASCKPSAHLPPGNTGG